MRRYRVTLTGGEREEIGRLLAGGRADVRELRHAQVLLKADEAEGGPGWTDERVAEALDVGPATVQRLRRRFVEGGLRGGAEQAGAIGRASRPPSSLVS